jgi:gas vesicle protein
MYYDDEARQFNFLSGLAFGAVLGAGLALLLSPLTRGRRSRRRLRAADWKNRAAGTLGRLRAGVADAVPDGLATARQRWQA